MSHEPIETAVLSITQCRTDQLYCCVRQDRTVMRVPIWFHVVVMFLLMVLGAIVFSFPIIFYLIYPIVVPNIQGLGISDWVAMLFGLVLSVAVIVIGMLPANLYFARASIPCAQVGCAGKAKLIATRPEVTYKCSTCGSLQKTWFGLRPR